MDFWWQRSNALLRGLSSAQLLPAADFSLKGHFTLKLKFLPFSDSLDGGCRFKTLQFRLKLSEVDCRPPEGKKVAGLNPFPVVFPLPKTCTGGSLWTCLRHERWRLFVSLCGLRDKQQLDLRVTPASSQHRWDRLQRLHLFWIQVTFVNLKNAYFSDPLILPTLSLPECVNLIVDPSEMLPSAWFRDGFQLLRDIFVCM